MPRFFADPDRIGQSLITLTDEDLRHIRSLRLRDTEQFTVCDGMKTDYICTLSGTDGQAEIIHSQATQGEPEQQCRVFAAFSKGERMEYTVQKAVELGAREIVLFPSDRCVVKYDKKSLEKKLLRWGKISLEAAKQCGRGIVPPVRAAGSFKEAVNEAAKADVPLFFYELEQSRGLRDTLSAYNNPSTLSIVTGPEGGFEPEEAEFAGEKNMNSITLGKRILRCETAPIAALAAIMYHMGNL